MRSFNVEVKWGIIFSLATVIWAALLTALGYTTTKIAQFPVVDSLFFMIAIVIYIMAFRSKRKQLNNKLTWVQALISGLIIGLIVMVFSIPGQVIIHKLIMPDFFKNSIDYAIRHHKMTAEEAHAYFNLTSYIKQILIFTPLAGIAIGAVVGLIMKRR